MSNFSRVTTRLVLVLCAAGIVALSCYALLTYSPEDDQFRVSFTALACSPAPSYVPAAFLAEVRTASQLPDSLDTRSPELALQLQRAFARHPWVAKVEQVAVQSRRHIEVRLQYRLPIGLVVVGPDRFLIDRDGVLLPRSPETAELEAGLLPIRGIAAPPLVSPGSRWEESGVTAAARVTGLVAGYRSRWELDSLQLGADPVQADLRLRTRKGSVIIWETLDNRRPGEDPSPAEKVRRLQAYCDSYGGLDVPDGPYLLDVRPAAGMLRQRLMP